MDLVIEAPHITRSGETLMGGNFYTNPGGKGANQAVAVGKLGYPVMMVGKVGDDAFGTSLRESLSTSGVDTSCVQTAETSSGVAMITVAKGGENSIVVSPGANNFVTPSYLEECSSAISGAGLILTQLELPLETIYYLGQFCSERNIPLILDPAPAQKLSPELLEQVAWFTPNDVEAAFYAGRTADEATDSDAAELARRLLAHHIKGVLLKMGSRGAFVAEDTGTARAIAPTVVSAIDTTAAGDAFNGAFAVALMSGRTPYESAQFAAKAAALSVTRRGAQSSMATSAEIATFRV